ncbi:beta/alpha barrel domain-containing protein [Gluconobacter kanchanaburiensis]|uniref:Fructose-bisphosphate aldolase n=1 Tax=Gluconobacter kanchanaburiensis NBRC 103587 TaxID=1307948 RepID=A0A511B7M5_9PROT|nr:hypothetical protein [Gluconobacter kanchanaburiensis]MBF0862432.1 hypothetical protein [Gluconobacter kanchanaburiensis]GBR68655.1 hypothetical protein AA103587_0916 [Gluconobacter kanchanaburiensis NBRC 103587]GEK96446.1 hypothetical protein GKA01_16430 [Gluconobacter kanchanaburiensis NBRC 103587]
MTTSPDYRNTRFWEKLSRIRAGQYRTGDFMIADAKDVDVAGGVPSMGRCRDEATGASGRLRTRPEFLDQVRELIRQDVLDIMLSSTATIEQLTDEGVFDGTKVLSAFRGNEATDAWVGIRGGRYRDFPPRPYRGAALEFARAPLCLYSITYINDAEHDASSLETYARFRAEARANDKMHFLEVFNPNVETGIAEDQIGFFINDCVIRTLASLTRRERPEFLKVAYNGPASLEELAGHDPSMVIGVLGGGSGTHRDTFELLSQAERYGARLALFGRKINGSEDQCAMIRWMRRVVDRDVSAEEAVRGYHGDLQKQGLVPDRSLEKDLQITDSILKKAAI